MPISMNMACAIVVSLGGGLDGTAKSVHALGSDTCWWEAT
jgi:hypothetical protein